MTPVTCVKNQPLDAQVSLLTGSRTYSSWITGPLKPSLTPIVIRGDGILRSYTWASGAMCLMYVCAKTSYSVTKQNMNITQFVWVVILLINGFVVIQIHGMKTEAGKFVYFIIL